MNPSRLASLSLTVPRSCALAMLLVLLLPLQACSTEVRIVELPRGPIGAEEAAACPAKGETKAWVKMNPAGAPREGVTPESVIACDYTPTGQYRQRRTSDAAMIEALQLPFVRDSPPIDEQKPPGVCPAAVFPIDRVVFIFDYGPAGATVIDPQLATVASQDERSATPIPRASGPRSTVNGSSSCGYTAQEEMFHATALRSTPPSRSCASSTQFSRTASSRPLRVNKTVSPCE